MDFTFLIVSFIINIIICFGIPIGTFIYLLLKKRQHLKSFLLGVVVFLVSQIFLRIPLINNVLSQTDWFMMLPTLYPIIYSIFLGLSAGVFEEVGRFIGFRFGLKDKRTWTDGLVFGIGHGGIEALLISGVACIQNLIALISLSMGTYTDSILGVDQTTAVDMYLSVSNLTVLTVGVERLLAIGIHIGLSILVLYGLNQNKGRYKFLVIAILIHTVIDAVVVILQQLGFGIVVIEVWCAICSLFLIIYSIKSKKIFNN